MHVSMVKQRYVADEMLFAISIGGSRGDSCCGLQECLLPCILRFLLCLVLDFRRSH